MNANPPKEKLAASKRPRIDESSYVQSGDVKYESDIFIMRGQSGAKYPGNRLFRRLISSNKAHFDTLATHEQEAFAASFWSNLSLCHRFLRSTGTGYEVLNDDKSKKKCHQALVSCRTGFNERVESQQLSIKKQRPDGSTLNFDDVAKKSIATLLSTEELADAMKTIWKSDAERKRVLLENKVRFAGEANTCFFNEMLSSKSLSVSY